MRRKITKSLIEWKDSENRKPLIVNGARQVGKSYIINMFGEEYFDNIITVNFEINRAICEFIENDITPSEIIKYLEITTGERIVAGATLIFFDEIQACSRALTSLKYFCEQAAEYHVIAAGSLLGVAINRENYSFPVGKVDEINLFPLDFEEYLWALGKDDLAQLIREHYNSDKMLATAYHDLGIKLYNDYLIVGGMPEAIMAYRKSDSYLAVQQVQRKILNEYIADMSKYATNAMSVKIRSCYDSIPAQLAKNNSKFQYKVVKRGGTATIFGEAIDWLLYAGITLKCQNLEHAFIPLKAYSDLANFKLYMGDVGLLTMLSNMSIQTILSPLSEDNGFIGGMAENYIAQVLATKGITPMYWHSEGKAEIDFVMQLQDLVIPIEVKSGLNVRSKSLNVFMKRYNCEYGMRLSKRNFGFENNIKSVPLYAAFCI